MTEKEKMLAGMIYDANNDSALIEERLKCKELCRDYNDLRPCQTVERETLLREILGEVKEGYLSNSPFIAIMDITFASERISMPTSIL